MLWIECCQRVGPTLYDWLLQETVSRQRTDQSKAKAVKDQEAAVSPVSQDVAVGHFGGLDDMLLLVCVQTWFLGVFVLFHLAPRGFVWCDSLLKISPRSGCVLGRLPKVGGYFPLFSEDLYKGYSNKMSLVWTRISTEYIRQFTRQRDYTRKCHLLGWRIYERRRNGILIHPKVCNDL